MVQHGSASLVNLSNRCPESCTSGMERVSRLGQRDRDGLIEPFHWW